MIHQTNILDYFKKTIILNMRQKYIGIKHFGLTNRMGFDWGKECDFFLVNGPASCGTLLRVC